MLGEAANQIDNAVTFLIDSDYEFREGELAEIRSMRDDYLQQLRGLFWKLIEFMAVGGGIWMLPEEDRKWFSYEEDDEKLRAKFYTLIRFRCGWICEDYDSDGKPRITARSTSNSEITQGEFSDFYQAAYEYCARWVDMKIFDRMHERARERLGKTI